MKSASRNLRVGVFSLAMFSVLVMTSTQAIAASAIFALPYDNPASAIPGLHLAMAKPPPPREPAPDSGPGRPVSTGRYIVTHVCPSLTPEQVSGSMSGMEYTIESRMQFTPQFVVIASPDAIARLRSRQCVSQIQQDGLSAPAQ